MTQNTGNTLYVVQQNFLPETADLDNRRFDYEHVPDLLACEGFLGCERFQLTPITPAGWPRSQRRTEFLNLWQIETPAVLAGEAYRLRSVGPDASWDGRTPQHRWRQGREKSGVITPPPAPGPRIVWRRLPSPWVRPYEAVMPAPRSLLVVFRDVDVAQADEVSTFYDEVAIPELLGCPGFLSCERYESIDVPVGPAHKNVPLGPATIRKFLEIYEVTSPEVLSSPEFAAHSAKPDPRALAFGAHMTVPEHGVYFQRTSPWALTPRPTAAKP